MLTLNPFFLSSDDNFSARFLNTPHDLHASITTDKDDDDDGNDDDGNDDDDDEVCLALIAFDGVCFDADFTIVVATIDAIAIDAIAIAFF